MRRVLDVVVGPRPPNGLSAGAAELGFIAADDPRFVATVQAIEADLMQDGLLMRYREPDDFGLTQPMLLGQPLQQPDGPPGDLGIQLLHRPDRPIWRDGHDGAQHSVLLLSIVRPQLHRSLHGLRRHRAPIGAQHEHGEHQAGGKHQHVGNKTRFAGSGTGTFHNCMAPE